MAKRRWYDKKRFSIIDIVIITFIVKVLTTIILTIIKYL